MHDPLESDTRTTELVNRAIRGLPLRRAPVALEARVLRELQRAATTGAWRRGFAYWPLSARAGFVLACGGIVTVTVLDVSWAKAAGTVLNAGSLALSWLHPSVAAASSLTEVPYLLLRVVPAGWLYGGLAAAAMLYAFLFGLGAAAYRTLYVQSSNAGDRS